MSIDTSASWIWISYGAFAVILFSFIGYHICKATQDSSSPPISKAPEKPVRSIGKKGGLHSDILKEGTGPTAKSRDTLTVHYTAFLTTGEKMDSSYDRGRAFTFKLGVGRVILGWDEALVGMKVGEKRKLTVPADLAYGKNRQRKIPPNSTVVFEIELLSIDSN